MSQRGWPSHKASVTPLAQQFWQVRDEVYSEHGLVFVGDRVVIPESLRQEIISALHDTHIGIEKCKNRARAIMYWPGMSRDIQDAIARCSVCAKFQRSNTQEPMLPHEVPDRLWAKLGSDIFTFNGTDHLLVVDYFSKYPEVVSLKTKTAQEIINKLKSLFARHGVPDTLVSDNMPYASHVFRQFAADWNFNLVTSSPTYPQSNGQSERFVQTIKQLMRKVAEDGKDIYKCLLDFRDSPISGLQVTPAQLLMGRRLKSILPVSSRKLMPQPAVQGRDELVARQQQMARYYNRGKRELPSLQPGESCRIRQGHVWNRAVVVQPHTTPRSYTVMTENGATYHRNRTHLSVDPDKSAFQVTPDIADPDCTPTEQKETLESPTNIGFPKASSQPPVSVCERPARARCLPKRFDDYVMYK